MIRRSGINYIAIVIGHQSVVLQDVSSKIEYCIYARTEPLNVTGLMVNLLWNEYGSAQC